MAQQNKQLVKWTPTPFMMRLHENTDNALAILARYSPERVDAEYEQYEKLTDMLDSLNRNLSFLLDEYKGPDKATLCRTVKGKIEEVEIRRSHLLEPRSLSTLARENREACQDMLLLMINNLRKFYQIDNMISVEGMKALVPLIVSHYKELTLEDVAVCLNMAKVGEYGKVYARIDGQVIMQWLREYAKAKRERKHLKEMNRHMEMKVRNDAEPKRSLAEQMKVAEAAVLIEKAREKKK